MMERCRRHYIIMPCLLCRLNAEEGYEDDDQPSREWYRDRECEWQIKEAKEK